MMKIFGIFLLSFLWLRNKTMTVKLVMIPIEPTILSRRTKLALMDFTDTSSSVVNVSFRENILESVEVSIMK